MKQIVTVLFFAALSFHTVAASKPNFIVILVDDMGFSDIGCYGGEIPTPNIDALAAGGLRFTQFYNTGRCCPTRAALFTGLYPHQAGIGHMTTDRGVPGYRGFLNDRCVTLGEVLRGAGYFTAHTGKWHVGHGDDARLPLLRGFDRFYGVLEGRRILFHAEGRAHRATRDLGQRDLGTYGSAFYETPNLDRLAKDGAKFGRARRREPACAPPQGEKRHRSTRHALLVLGGPGRHPGVSVLSSSFSVETRHCFSTSPNPKANTTPVNSAPNIPRLPAVSAPNSTPG